MLTRIPNVQPGDPLSAESENALRERVNRLSCGPSMYAPTGTEQAHLDEATYLDLYELTEDPVWDDDAREYYANGVQVWQRWCTVDGSGHWLANSVKIPGATKLRARASTRANRIWLVTCPRDDNQEASSSGGYKAGDRVLVTLWFKAYVAIGPASVDQLTLYEIVEDTPQDATYDTDADEYRYQAKPVVATDNAGIVTWAVDTGADEVTLWHVTAIRKTDDDTAVPLPSFYRKQRVYALYNRLVDKWEIVSPPLDIWRFKIPESTTLTAGGTATVELVDDNGTYPTPPTPTFTVKDRLGIFGSKQLSSVNAGAEMYGYAKYMPDANQWEIIALGHQAIVVEFELTESLTTATASAHATLVRYYQGVDPPTDVDADEITVYNFEYASSKYDFDGPIGARGFAVWDEQDHKHRIIHVQYPAMERAADQYWIGENDTHYLHHLQPRVSNAANDKAANPAQNWWYIGGECGVCYDDAGHFIGYWDTASPSVWHSPWGYADPNGGLPGGNNGW